MTEDVLRTSHVMGNHQIEGAEAVAIALSSGAPSVSLVLVCRGHSDPKTLAVIEQANAIGVPVREESSNDFRRMGRQPNSTVLALIGRSPGADLTEVMLGVGLVWLLSGVSYPSNVGVTIRSAEVAGAAGVVIDGPFNRPMRRRALRVAMRADRFMPVLWHDTVTTIDAARAAGRRVYALEDSGTVAPWNVDLTGPVVLVVGGEREGIAQETLDACDEVLRIPMPGFIPSYNLQTVVTAVAVERLRQISM